MLRDLQQYQQHRNCLLAVPFTSIDDYLSLLEAVSIRITQFRRQLAAGVSAAGSGNGMDACGRVIYFLAAAVSDFYVPPEQLPQHKLQSGQLLTPRAESTSFPPPDPPAAAQLRLNLCPVPKRLGALVADWAPGSFVASFKLETDPALLQTKARMAIRNYAVHLVVANQLQVSGCVG